MELKTNVTAEEGKQELTITREFDLPVELLFKAYTEAEFVEQWMDTTVLKLETKKHGSFQFETTRDGQIVFRANGTIHDVATNKTIIRTFEMENTSFGVQLEVYHFEEINEDKSKLSVHIVFQTSALRDQMLKLPFKHGINFAHGRLQDTMNKLK